MSRVYKSAKQSLLARINGVHCNYKSQLWRIEARGLLLGTSCLSAKDAWIKAKENELRGRIKSSS